MDTINVVDTIRLRLNRYCFMHELNDTLSKNTNNVFIFLLIWLIEVTVLLMIMIGKPIKLLFFLFTVKSLFS